MKKLPLGEPLFNFTPPYNYLTSLINTDNKYYSSYIENYINIEYYKNNYCWLDCINFLNWSEYKFLEVKYLNRELSIYSKNIISILCDFLNQDYYIALNIDQYYIKQYPNYNKRHYRHDIFIFGYDKFDNTFICKDFFGDSFFSTKFSEQKCDFNDILNGIINFPKKAINDITIRAEDHLNGIVLFKLKKDFIYECNYKKMYIDLFNLKTKFKSCNSIIDYGFNWFDDFYLLWGKNPRNEKWFSWYYLKMFFQFWHEHVLAMKNREMFIINKFGKNHDYDIYDKLLKLILINRNTVIKLVIKNQVVETIHLKQFINNMKEFEGFYYKSICDLMVLIEEI